MEYAPEAENPYTINTEQISLESITLDDMGFHSYRLRRSTTSDYGSVTDDFDFDVEFIHH